MGKGLLLAGGIGLALMAGWSNAEGEGCGGGMGRRVTAVSEDCAGEGHEWHREFGHAWGFGSLGLGRYDLSEEDMARIESILEEAHSEIEAILAGYEPLETPVGAGGCGSAEGCGGCGD